MDTFPNTLSNVVDETTNTDVNIDNKEIEPEAATHRCS